MTDRSETLIQNETLAALDQAFAGRNFSEADDYLTELEEAYNLSEDTLSGSTGTQSDSQQEQAAVARTLRDTGNVTEGKDVATLDKFGWTYATTQYSRSLVVYIGRVIIGNHEALAENGDLDDLITVVRNGITDLQSAEDKLASQTTETETITQNVSAPPVLTVSATANSTNLAVDDTTTATITVTNSGDEAATDVTVSVTTPSGITTPDSDATVSRIAGGGDATTEIMLRGTEPGIRIIDIEANTPDTTTVARTLLTISVASTTDEGSQNTGENSQSTGDNSGNGGDNSRGIIGGLIAAGLAGSGYLAYRFRSDEEDDNYDSSNNRGTRQEESYQHSGRTEQRQSCQSNHETKQKQSSQHSGDRATKRSTQFCTECGETLSIEVQRCSNCGSEVNPPGN